MNKTAVVFQSKYGSTKKYAQWIAEALSCDLLERKNVKTEDLKTYDTIVYGGGLYAGGVSGLELITKNYESLADKNLILFTCGLADVSRATIPTASRRVEKAMSAEMQERSGLSPAGRNGLYKARAPHKAMMGMVRKATPRKPRTSEPPRMTSSHKPTARPAFTGPGDH